MEWWGSLTSRGTGVRGGITQSLLQDASGRTFAVDRPLSSRSVAPNDNSPRKIFEGIGVPASHDWLKGRHAGTTMTTTATATATKAIAMTTKQKTLIAAGVAFAEVWLTTSASSN
jgi:hypothetical protein